VARHYGTDPGEFFRWDVFRQELALMCYDQWLATLGQQMKASKGGPMPVIVVGAL